MPATESSTKAGPVARSYFEAIARQDLEAMVNHWEPGGTGEIHGLVTLTGCDLLTIRGGRIQRNDAYMNGAQMVRQLGALPPAGSLAERGMLAALNLKTRLTQALRR